MNDTDTCLEIFHTAASDIIEYFQDEKVLEISLNPDGKIWIDRLGEGRSWTGKHMPPERAMNMIAIIASMTDTTITAAAPILSTEIPYYGSRFEGNIPPIVEQPIFSIRQKARMVFFLEDYIRQHILSERQAVAIRQAIKKKANILVVGGTGSGKTTFVNAILAEFQKLKDRIIILEDTKELQCTAEDTIYLRTSDNIDMTRLLKSCMRHSPNRIIVGEVRDAAALALIKAWNTGHPGGVCTVHANSAYDGLIRIEQLIQEEIVTPQRRLIGNTIDFIIYMEKIGNHRKIQEILHLRGYDAKTDDYITETIGE